MPVASAAAANASREKKKNQRRSSSGGLGDDDTSGASTPSRFEYIAVAMQQEKVRQAYQNPTVQWMVAGLIMGNFLTNIVEKQIDPWGTELSDEFFLIDSVWNCIFIMELVVNIYSSWYLSTWKGHFLCSGWNVFDAIVVGVSVPTLTGADLGSFSQMRMLRAFRVFRLFKRIKSLNKIITSLGRAVPGIINAAIVQLLVMCIYAILGVDLFGNFAGDGNYANIENTTVGLVTARSMTYGEEYYGTFVRSLYTLFQVLTGESWSEAVARPVLYTEELCGPAPCMYVAAIFYVSYIIICGIVLVNVAVAVLLEKMVDVEEPAEVDGILLKDLPENAQRALQPLDGDNDGMITTAELVLAAKLMRNSSLEGSGAAPTGESSAALSRLAAAAEGTRDDLHVEMERCHSDITQLRAETKAREDQLLEALQQAAAREAVLQESLTALSGAMERLASANALRQRRKAPQGAHAAAKATVTASPAATNGVASTKGNVSGMTGMALVATPVAEEDKMQDGERIASRGAPDRQIHQRL